MILPTNKKIYILSFANFKKSTKSPKPKMVLFIDITKNIYGPTGELNKNSPKMYHSTLDIK